MGNNGNETSATVHKAKAQPLVEDNKVTADKPKSTLTPADVAAMENMFSALDENYKTSYDLTQMSTQVAVVQI